MGEAYEKSRRLQKRNVWVCRICSGASSERRKLRAQWLWVNAVGKEVRHSDEMPLQEGAHGEQT